MNKHIGNDLVISHDRQDKIPASTQEMWELAVADYEHETIMLDMLRHRSDATREVVKRRERNLLVRKAICNAINFLITNKDDVNKVISARKR